MLSRDDCQYTPSLKAKGIIEDQKPDQSIVEAIIKRGMIGLWENYLINADNSKIMGK